MRRALTLGTAITAALALVPFAPAQTTDLPPEPTFTPRSAIADRGPPPSNLPEPVTVFFPPPPPPHGRTIVRNPARAPAELAAHVNELFYPALATRLDTGNLRDGLRTRLDQHRATKLALQHELRAELNRLRDAKPATRLAELTTLNRRQTPKLVELEAAAEQLRRDLTISRRTWGALREWHLGNDDPRGYAPGEVAEVMRAAAYVSDDLSLDQRGLLREIAIELETPADSAANASKAQPYLFFLPSPARALLPEDVSAGVAARLATYQPKKSALKKELYDAVYAQDGAKLGFLRHPLKPLAEKQAARFAELETLAEEIRRGLDPFVVSPPPLGRSPLPPTLQARLDRAGAGFLAAQREAAARIDAVVGAAREVRMTSDYRFESGRLTFAVRPIPDPRESRRGVERVDTVRAGVAAVAEAYALRLADFVRDRETIRTEAVGALGATRTDQVEPALVAALSLAAVRDTADLYREYRLAIFQPGLSPEQRRLLFDGAIERLQLPLPGGKRQPMSR
ncbi:MAG: hypothetical protein EXS43_09250 [Opitutus sp.]|nr:hypothetical protein [Opitutus sp.]